MAEDRPDAPRPGVPAADVAPAGAGAGEIGASQHVELAPQPAPARPAPPPLPPLPDDTWGRVARRVEVFWPIIDRVAVQLQLSQALIEAVIHMESGGDPDAFPENPARDGASFGLMQLLLPTARAVGYGGKVPALFGADLNITLGSRYLAGLVREWGDVATALVAYNGGPGAARRFKLHLPAGPAAGYSRTVLALRDRYAARNRQRA